MAGSKTEGDVRTSGKCYEVPLAVPALGFGIYHSVLYFCYGRCVGYCGDS